MAIVRRARELRPEPRIESTLRAVEAVADRLNADSADLRWLTEKLRRAVEEVAP